MNWLKALYPTLLAIAISTTAVSQTAKGPFAVVPASQRTALSKRLIAYTTAFRKRDWAGLYDLVSDENKINPGKPVFSSETKEMSFVKVTVVDAHSFEICKVPTTWSDLSNSSQSGRTWLE
jgi:hypothetical protein